MSLVGQILVSDLATFTLTVIGTSFVMGQRIGKMQERLNGIEKELARIGGMFELRLRQDHRHDGTS